MSPLARVSFVIPVKDDADRLRRCLESVAHNEYPRALVDVIVVDNGSTDDSARIARDAGATVLVAREGRVADLRNLGADAATGEVLAFVDADHEIAPGWIGAAVAALTDDRVAAVGSPCDAPSDGTWVQRRYDRLRMKRTRTADVDWLGSGNMAVRRDVFEASGRFDERLEACEDVDLCNRIRRAGYRIVSDPALGNIHFGDPKTLGALFRGEMWRGRDNLRVTFRGPRTIRHWRSALVPVAQLAAAAALAVTMGLLPQRAWPVSIALTMFVMAPAVARTALMIRPDDRRTPVLVAQSLVVALTYDAGRAAALVARATHHSRRAAEQHGHVAADSHS